LTVVSIAINDNPETLKRFMTRQSLSYPVLQRGTFYSPFARSYNVHAAPTNLVISPDGEIRFVGRGPMSLKTAVGTIALGQHSVAARE
jgi:hypothetical protein